MKNSSATDVPGQLRTPDWARWQPSIHATLLFVLKDGQALLIQKKRGLGAGKINGPGGKIDPGEEPLAAAIREVQEELGVTPLQVSERGELSFQFLDGLALHVRVYVALDHAGEPMETEEAVPLWVDQSAFPYDQMWEDDRFWVPHMLAGRGFALRAVFDGDRMLDHELELRAWEARGPDLSAPER